MFQSAPSFWAGRIKIIELIGLIIQVSIRSQFLGWENYCRDDIAYLLLSGFNPLPVFGLGELQLADSSIENERVSIRSQFLGWENWCIIGDASGR